MTSGIIPKNANSSSYWNILIIQILNPKSQIIQKLLVILKHIDAEFWTAKFKLILIIIIIVVTTTSSTILLIIIVISWCQSVKKNLSKTLLFGKVQFSCPEKFGKLTCLKVHLQTGEGDDGRWGSTKERSKGSLKEEKQRRWEREWNKEGRGTEQRGKESTEERSSRNLKGKEKVKGKKSPSRRWIRRQKDKKKMKRRKKWKRKTLMRGGWKGENWKEYQRAISERNWIWKSFSLLWDKTPQKPHKEN